jgi:glycosyltransferase involved in cell wall biosynthesis
MLRRSRENGDRVEHPPRRNDGACGGTLPDRLEIGAVWLPTGTVAACEHLRLTGPFGWLERNEGWAPLDYAVKRRRLNPWQLRALRRVRRFSMLNPVKRLAFGAADAGDSVDAGTVAITSPEPASSLAHTVRRAYRSPRLRTMIAGWSEKVVLEPSANASALLVWREAMPEYTEQAFAMAKQRRIPLVYDTDDLLIALPDNSPLAEDYRALRPVLTRWIRQADHVTVANAVLADELSELNSSISILPSFMDVDLWGVSEIPPPDDAPVSIGYWGSLGHVLDLQRLTAAFRHLKQRYGRRIRFQFMGSHDPEILSLEHVTVGGYVDSYAAYAAATRSCRVDIAIAPLADNRFNRCKSPIKFFEYSIRGACGIYADLVPYHAVVRHGENGLLIGADLDDWVSALERLIEDPTLRYQMARQAQADVLAHHTLDRHAWRWRDTYQRVVERGPMRAGRSASLVPSLAQR